MKSLTISKFIAAEAQESGISNPSEGSYDAQLVSELYRIGLKGGRIQLEESGLRDLAEWCESLAISHSQGDNPSGARSMRSLADKAWQLARVEALAADS